MKQTVIFLLVVQSLLLSCGEKTPEAVYVKDELYSESLTVGISEKMIVADKWYELSAQRRTGPWKKINRTDLPEGQCWILRPPPEKEDNVTNNLKWVSDPDAPVEYSIPQNPFREPRKVKFKEVGRYTLKAISSSWCGAPFESNRVDIEVVRPVAGREDRIESSGFPLKENINEQAPYVTTPIEVVRAMLDLGAVGPDDFLIDLGSGDGRIVITAAKEYGASGFGVDLDQELVALSKRNAAAAGVQKKTDFFARNIFETDIRKATVVTLYLLNEVNRKLRPKLLNELTPGTRVVSHDFHMGEWRPDIITHLDNLELYRKDSILYLWKIPAKIAGRWHWQLVLRGEIQFFDLEMDQMFQVISGVVHNRGCQFPFFNPLLEGDWIRFSVISEADERMVQQDYSGRVRGDTIDGTVTLGGGHKRSALKWRAERVRQGLPAGFAADGEHGD